MAQPGVAPEDFYATTIYPTEVRVGGDWERGQGQPLDRPMVVTLAAFVSSSHDIFALKQVWFYGRMQFYRSSLTAPA